MLVATLEGNSGRTADYHGQNTWTIHIDCRSIISLQPTVVSALWQCVGDRIVGTSLLNGQRPAVSYRSQNTRECRDIALRCQATATD